MTHLKVSFILAHLLTRISVGDICNCFEGKGALLREPLAPIVRQIGEVSLLLVGENLLKLRLYFFEQK